MQEISEPEQEDLAERALQSAVRSFSELERNFSEESVLFSQLTERELNNSVNKQELYNLINTQFDFWGVSIFRNQELWLWSGFGEQQFTNEAGSIQRRQKISIHQDNNVTYLSSQIPLFRQEGDQLVRYDVFTRKKLRQENLLTIGKNAELQPNDYLETENNYPVHYNFFGSLPPNTQYQATLSTNRIDSAGVAYTLSEDFPSYKTARENRYLLIRAVFYVILIIITSLFLISMSRELSSWGALFLKLFAIIVAWAFFANIEYGLSWLELFPAIEKDNFDGLKLLIYYCINSGFFLLITLSVFSSASYGTFKIKDKINQRIAGIDILFGYFSALIISFFFSETYLLFKNTFISAMDLEIIPGFMISVFYLSSGIFAFSIISLLCLLGWFFLRSGYISEWGQFLLMFIGFTIGLISVSVLGIYDGVFSWLWYTASGFFISISFLFYLLSNNPFLIKYSSRLRMLLLFSFITASITYIPAYQGYVQRLDAQMLNSIDSFINNEEPQAEIITRNLLSNLESVLSDITLADLEQRRDFVESYFDQRTQEMIAPQWESYSISTQLIDTTGQLVAEFTSDLDSPNWTSNFLIQSLELPYEQERIRIQNPRPIIQDRPLNESHSRYAAFRRGWIPLHEETNGYTRIGWILCSVYKERPQYDKPLRAVVAAENNTNWDYPINITEFKDGTAARSSVLGIPLELPGYFQLSDTLIKQTKRDSVIFRTTLNENQRLREYFVATGEQTIVRAATTGITFENHLFAILRFFFSLLIAGLIVLSLLSWKEELNILGHNRRFRDRLIDRFILASILCLMVLSVTSYYAISDQNKDNVQDQLLSKVRNLAEVLTMEDEQSEGESILSLQELSSALDADATLYRDQVVSLSTSTQIYDQHILPGLLPWDVYESILINRNVQYVTEIKLGNNELLIGYQPWFDDQGEIAGITAIPTFLKAPKFNQQLLSTTSYLLGFYVLIFGFFIIGAAYISTQLTEPLLSIRKGLKKISSGDLETKLPVKSKDEIGSLSHAYNTMVEQLKSLQRELAIAEREAAWKEMAQQVAHEIKNPLTPMKLSLQHLERQLKGNPQDLDKFLPKIERITTNMIEQIDSLNHIASDFSKFAKPIDQDFVSVEINQLLNSVAELYEPEEKITIEKELYPQELFVRGVKEELRRVLVNLVKNAYEAMPEGGTITLCSLTAEDKPFVLIEVLDTGEGIPDENAQDIFVPNFSTKSSGTGLGLAISKKIIEEHKGKISFESNGGQGTIFRVSLPLSEETSSE